MPSGQQERCGLNLSFDACTVQLSSNQNLLTQSGALSTFVTESSQFSAAAPKQSGFLPRLLRHTKRRSSHLRAVTGVALRGHHGLSASRALWSILALDTPVPAHDRHSHSQADSEQAHREASQHSDEAHFRAGTIELPGQDAVRRNSSVGDLPLAMAVQGDVLDICSPVVLSTNFPCQ